MGLGTKIGAEDSDGASMSSNAKIVLFQRYPVIAIFICSEHEGKQNVWNDFNYGTRDFQRYLQV